MSPLDQKMVSPVQYVLDSGAEPSSHDGISEDRASLTVLPESGTSSSSGLWQENKATAANAAIALM